MKASSLILWGVAAFAGYKLYKKYQANKLAEAQKKAMDEASEEFEETPEVDSQFSNASYGAAAAYRGSLIPDNLRHGWGQRGATRTSIFNDVVMAEYGRLRPMAWETSRGKQYFANAVNDCAGSAGGSCYTWIRVNGVPTQVQGTIGSDCKCNPVQGNLRPRATSGSIV
jgi:hypothetical protein